MNAFFTLHSGLSREGPGEAGDVHWALTVAGTRGAARILDAGCGPGADTGVLAEALPEAQIQAVDLHAHFVSAAQAATADYGARISVRQMEMAVCKGPFDLIWCAGSAYFLGVRQALERWRVELAPGGAIAFSEVCWLRPDPPQVLRDHWAQYPLMRDAHGVRDWISSAGYHVMGERTLSDQAWENYFTPMAQKIAALRAENPDAELAQVLAEAEEEAMIWRQYREYAGYTLFVVAPK